MSLKHFTRETFEKELNGGALMLVDFWAEWCGPCRMLGPVIEGLADEYEGRAVIGKVNVDEEGELAMRYGVMNIPTVILFKNGREIDRKVGVMPGAVFTRRWTRICKSQSGPRTTGAGPAFIHASGEARSRSSSSRVSLGRRARRRITCPSSPARARTW